MLSESLPPAEVQHDKIPEAGALRQRDVAEKSRRGKAEAECGDAAAHEIASGELHTS